jgi:hypothetical protein
MNKLRRVILWVVLWAIGLLILFSILGAFLGERGLAEYFREVHEADAVQLLSGTPPGILDRLASFRDGTLEVAYRFFGGGGAGDLFNSAPLAVFWIALAVLLAGGLVFFRRLVATPAGLMMHLGSLLVVGGALWGSVQGHDLRARWLGSEKVPGGYLRLFVGDEKHSLFGGDFRTRLATLPFTLRQTDFRTDYYPAAPDQCALAVLAPPEDAAAHAHGHPVLLDWAVGRETEVPGTPVRLTVLQFLPNGGSDAEGEAQPERESPYPALQVLLMCEGRRQTVWMFPDPDDPRSILPLGPFLRNVPADDEADPGPILCFAARPAPVQAWRSSIEVRRGDDVAARQVVRMNHPLHWGGYHFYLLDVEQTSEGDVRAVFHAVSDDGLTAVYLGLLLLVVGTFWRFWLEPAGGYVWNGK